MDFNTAWARVKATGDIYDPTLFATHIYKHTHSAPKSGKRHTWTPNNHTPVTPQETVRQKQARYGVWDEYRGRVANHIEPYSAARMKAQHQHAMNVFDHAIAVLEKAYWSNQ